MAEQNDFEYVNRTYMEVFGITQMNVFFEEKPVRNYFFWHLKRYLVYFFCYFYYPVWLTIQLLGIFVGNEIAREALYFQVGYWSHVGQCLVKMLYFLRRQKELPSLCLQFEKFHTSKHRPTFTRKVLEEKGRFLRKLANITLNLMQFNGITWNITALVIQPILFVLLQNGVIKTGPKTPIPQIFDLTYPFEQTSSRNRIIIAVLEFLVLNGGVFYNLPIDMFFMSVFLMTACELDIICKSCHTTAELSRELDKDYSTMLGPHDRRDRLDLRLLIEDHQKVLRITKKIRETMNVILGVEICYFIVLLATLALAATAQMKGLSSVADGLKHIPGMIAGFISVLAVLYLYSWMCGSLKEAEDNIFEAIYNTNWYERNKKYRDTVLIMMSSNIKARPLRMLSIGDMDRETFVNGLKGIYTYYNYLANFE